MFREAFIYRLCCPLWKVGQQTAASLKKKDLSFITNSASLEYFSPTVGHISDVFSLMLIQVICRVLHLWASLSPSNYQTDMEEEQAQNAFGISRHRDSHSPVNFNRSWPHRPSENAGLCHFTLLWEKTKVLSRNIRQAWTPSPHEGSCYRLIII